MPRSHDKTSGSSPSCIRDVCLAPDERGRARHVASHPRGSCGRMAGGLTSTAARRRAPSRAPSRIFFTPRQELPWTSTAGRRRRAARDPTRSRRRRSPSSTAPTTCFRNSATPRLSSSVARSAAAPGACSTCAPRPRTGTRCSWRRWRRSLARRDRPPGTTARAPPARGRWVAR